MSAPRRPDLVLCSPRGAGIEPLRERLAAHPEIAWVPPREAARLDRLALTPLALGPSFDLQLDGPRNGAPPAGAAEIGPRYRAWQPQRFIEFAAVQWNVVRHLAGAKLLFCLRDPVDLAHARYLACPDEMPSSLERAITECEAAMAELGTWESRGSWDGYFIKPSPLSLLLAGGVYATPLDRCRRLVGRQQVHCVTCDELTTDPVEALSGVWEFLGLPAVEPAPGEPWVGTPSLDEPISGSARARLEEFYAEHNARLARLLGGLPAGWS